MLITIVLEYSCVGLVLGLMLMGAMFIAIEHSWMRVIGMFRAWLQFGTVR